MLNGVRKLVYRGSVVRSALVCDLYLHCSCGRPRRRLPMGPHAGGQPDPRTIARDFRNLLAIPPLRGVALVVARAHTRRAAARSKATAHVVLLGTSFAGGPRLRTRASLPCRRRRRGRCRRLLPSPIPARCPHSAAAGLRGLAASLRLHLCRCVAARGGSKRRRSGRRQRLYAPARSDNDSATSAFELGAGAPPRALPRLVGPAVAEVTSRPPRRVSAPTRGVPLIPHRLLGMLLASSAQMFYPRWLPAIRGRLALPSPAGSGGGGGGGSRPAQEALGVGGGTRGQARVREGRRLRPGAAAAAQPPRAGVLPPLSMVSGPLVAVMVGVAPLPPSHLAHRGCGTAD
mmetsp:Transcript_105134/g.267094  ORF Transcript_105134/g.267094 Transcript_105134/m.267094 type:complete len:345 (+) Transcript_105134:650-1684(+)